MRLTPSEYYARESATRSIGSLVHFLLQILRYFCIPPCAGGNLRALYDSLAGWVFKITRRVYTPAELSGSSDRFPRDEHFTGGCIKLACKMERMHAETGEVVLHFRGVVTLRATRPPARTSMHLSSAFCEDGNPSQVASYISRQCACVSENSGRFFCDTQVWEIYRCDSKLEFIKIDNVAR